MRLRDLGNITEWDDSILNRERTQFSGNDLDAILWLGHIMHGPAIGARAQRKLKRGGALILPDEAIPPTGPWVRAGSVRKSGKAYRVYFLYEAPVEDIEAWDEEESIEDDDVRGDPTLQQAAGAEEGTEDHTP